MFNFFLGFGSAVAIGLFIAVYVVLKFGPRL